MIANRRGYSKPRETSPGQTVSVLTLITEFESKLLELNHACLERRKELKRDLGVTTQRLNNIRKGLASHVSLLVARGVRPVSEEINGNNYCNYKHVTLGSLLIQEVERTGFGICQECGRVLISTNSKASCQAAAGA